MPSKMEISETECLKLSKLLDQASIPDSCKEYIAKNDKIKDAWAGASQKDRLRRNHTQLQRRLTSSRSQQRRPTKPIIAKSS